MIDCPFRLYPIGKLSVLCTLTGRSCLVEGDLTESCLRRLWADEYETKHGVSILDLGKAAKIEAAKQQELA